VLGLPSRAVGDAKSGEDLIMAFTRWAGDERIGDAALGRSRQRRMSDAISASATWAGVLLDVAENALQVVLTIGSRRLSCRIVGVGVDFCVTESEASPPAIVAVSAISALAPSPQARGSLAGDRPPPIGLSFAAALAALADERLPVAVWSGDVRIEGELLLVGQDVVSLRTAAPSRRLVYLPADRITVCEMR
jgi:hypothetical protein